VKKAELDIRMGDRIAIVGKNGSGKTSLLRKKHVLLLLYGSRHMLHAFLLIDSGSDKFGYCLEDLDALERPSYRLFQFSDLLVTTTLASLLQRHAQQLSWQPKLNPGIQRVESCIKGGARPRKPVI